MLVVISPAKSLDFNKTFKSVDFTQCEFLHESEKLVKKLKKLSPKKISELMAISPSLAELNYQRFQDWELPFTEENARPALAVFTGEVYRGINADDFSKNDLEIAQKKLRILSGLYGLLKPLDLIQPYRLEMGTKFKVTPQTQNLYQYWGNSITNALNKELETNDGVLINLASNEYFKAIKPKELKGKIVTCVFKDSKSGNYKVIMTFAKQARGFMSRFIIKNNINKVEDLKAFDDNGYVYNPKLSNENELVFTRG